MDIKSPKVFETSDKAHADLFNEMVKVLLKNDTGLLDQLGGHINDTKPHASEAEKKKWNESQLYKITADDGRHLIAVPADGSIFNAIKDKGMCTFVAYPGVEDSPAPSNAYLRGIQTVGQNNIGTGFAIDTSGNAYYFYYNSSHISITWTQLPTTTEKDKWNNGQLFRLTQNNGKPIYKGTSETTDYNEITDTGFYLIYNKGLNAPQSIDGAFMIVISYGTTLLQTVYEKVGLKSYYRVKKTDSTWTEWTRVLTEEDKITQSEKDKWNNGQLSKITADNGTPSIYVRDVNDSILDKIIDSGLGMGTFYAIAKSKDLPNDRSFRGFFHMTDTTNGKASFGWVYATDYVNNIYTNYLNNNVWSGWSRLSNHNLLSETGQSQLLPNGTDILTLPSGYYYAVGTNVVNMPSKTDSSWFNIYVIDNGNNRKTFHVIRSGDNLHWWGTVHTEGNFKGWKRMLTDDDSISTWNQVTLVAGTSAKHFAANPLKFSIRQNELLLRGSFEGVPANETVIARFAQNPSARTVFLGATVGSYGAARFTLEKDGSLRFDGMSANDNSYVSRFEINESIPLW
nr:hypothetical protein [Bacillus pumilus]